MKLQFGIRSVLIAVALLSMALGSINWVHQTRLRNPDALFNEFKRIGVRQKNKTYLGPAIYNQTPFVSPRENITVTDKLLGNTMQFCDGLKFSKVDVSPVSARLFANSSATAHFRSVIFEFTQIQQEAPAFLRFWKPEGLEIEDTQFPKKWRESVINNDNVRFLRLKGNTGFSVDELKQISNLRVMQLDESDFSIKEAEEISMAISGVHVFLFGKEQRVFTAVEDEAIPVDSPLGDIRSSLAELETSPETYECIEFVDTSGTRHFIPVGYFYFESYDTYLTDFHIVQLVRVGTATIKGRSSSSPSPEPIWLHQKTGELFYGYLPKLLKNRPRSVGSTFALDSDIVARIKGLAEIVESVTERNAKDIN